jgi:hypothetical protein
MEKEKKMYRKNARILLVLLLSGLGAVVVESPLAVLADGTEVNSQGYAITEKALSTQGMQPPSGEPVLVPEGNGVPVITDGLFGPGEWDDALRIALNETVELRLKQYRQVVFLGLRGLGSTSIGPSDLFLTVPGGSIHQLHVSAQLGEIVLPASGVNPPFRFGLTPDWYANEFRRGMKESERLEKAGKTPVEIIRATSFPSDGIEFAIRQSKFPASKWLLRLQTSFFAGDKPGGLVYPPSTEERKTDGWLVLRFQ